MAEKRREEIWDGGIAEWGMGNGLAGGGEDGADEEHTTSAEETDEDGKGVDAKVAEEAPFDGLDDGSLVNINDDGL